MTKELFICHEPAPRLRKGDVIEIAGTPHRVIEVSLCRALVQPMVAKEVCIGDRHFEVKADAFSISPNSECRILKRRNRGPFL